MKYKMLFDKIDPPRTDDEMINLVLSGGAETMPASKKTVLKKRSFKKTAVIAAVAAALAVGVTAAGASCGWNISKLLENFYSRISSESQEHIDTGIENQTAIADLSQMGINLDKTVDFGYGTVTFKGAAADRNTVILMYSITIDEKALDEFQRKFGNISGKTWADLSASENPSGCNLAASYGASGADYLQTNVYAFQNGFLTKDSAIDFEFDAFTISDSNHSRLEIYLEEPVKLSLPLYFMNTDCVSLSPGTDIIIDNFEYYLDDVVITPLSIQWYVWRGGKIGTMEGKTDPLIYRFRDGTEICNYQTNSTSEYNGDREFFTVLFDKPINPSDLESLTIGNYTIAF